MKVSTVTWLLVSFLILPVPSSCSFVEDGVLGSTDSAEPQRQGLGSSSSSIAGEDEHTLLDVFGEVAKEFFTNRMVPPTDAECRWEWKHARCEPYCLCSLQAKPGDFHLGRSCRFREETSSSSSFFDTTNNNNNNNNTTTDTMPWDDMDTHNNDNTTFASSCLLPPDTPYAVLFRSTTSVARATAGRTREAVRRARAATSRLARRSRLPDNLRRAGHEVCTALHDTAETVRFGGEVANFLCPVAEERQQQEAAAVGPSAGRGSQRRNERTNREAILSMMKNNDLLQSSSSSSTTDHHEDHVIIG